MTEIKYPYLLDPDYTSYDVKRAMKMVGTKPYPDDQSWVIFDYNHHHFLMIRDDGYFSFSKCKNVIERHDEEMAAVKLKNEGSIEKIFSGGMAFYNEKRYCYVVYAFPSDVIGTGGAMVDERRHESGAYQGSILGNKSNAMTNHYGNDWKFGFDQKGYSVYHTWKKNAEFPRGFDIQSGGDQIDLDAVTWVRYYNIPGLIMFDYKKQFENVYDDEDHMLVNIKGDTIVFMTEKRDKYDYADAFKFQGGGEVCYLSAYNHRAGDKVATNGMSGMHKIKFTIPKDLVGVPWKEVKKLVLNGIEKSLNLAFAEHPQVTMEKFLSGVSF